ncbi:pyridoxamine 5'-phosphate oxidase [Desulfonema ishimotonii]|uniref:Pyridoxamine 5'-phosphate oxidase n=1 Tax=Desulfonema ishimotonii TaxID=45657 RepID=A0A401FSZ6_9BACT|nr:pyridoxamine 5'-phosphate oxidase family protein [Desulfonema ishimotonii]GBC60070.1 pyridoxamine 5'-phosphate oxidase [Desulfonema ishimotonii]
MFRKDKEIKEKKAIETIIRQAAVCRLGMSGGEYPYVVPLCFAWQDGTLYFHSARKGQKLELLEKNPRVCFEIDNAGEVKKDEKPCKWGMAYESVIGFGHAEFITDNTAKRRALDLIMAHYSENGDPFEYSDAKINGTKVFKVTVERMTGKRSG